MGNTLKFNSSVCTSIEQSQRLLDLGLKPETADMNWTIVDSDREGNEYSVEYMSIGQGKYQLLHPNWYIPAWSLHRLLDMIPNVTDDNYWAFIMDNIHCWYNSPIDDHEDFEKGETIYDNIINCIEWLIKEDYFSKVYLKQ